MNKRNRKSSTEFSGWGYGERYVKVNKKMNGKPPSIYIRKIERGFNL